MAGFLVLLVVGGATDLWLDRPSSPWSIHVLVEVAGIVVSLTFAVILARGWWRTSRALAASAARLADARRDLAERQAERDAWRRSAESSLAGLGRAIEAQFDRWGLTPTEREVALLLLQGVGHKQIAGRTGRSERTVRQHAVSVYEKSGLGGRAELAAFFLQDLWPPAAGREPPTAS